MYPAQIGAKKPPQGRYHFEGFAATEPRFGFDAYCNMQLLFVHEPIASGAVMWFGRRWSIVHRRALSRVEYAAQANVAHVLARRRAT
jgi:hypothetical protein